MSIVSAEKVGTLARVVGRGDTSGSLITGGKLDGAFGSKDKVAMRFDALMGLYALVAMGSVSMSKSGRKLVFSRSG